MNSLFTSVCCFCIVSDWIHFVQLPWRVLKVQKTLDSVQSTECLRLFPLDGHVTRLSSPWLYTHFKIFDYHTAPAEQPLI